MQPISTQSPVLPEQLERYHQLALEQGASDTCIVTQTDLIIDPRVRLKCAQPSCGCYGTNRNCPPYTPALEQVREITSSFHWGLLIRILLPPLPHGKRTPEERVLLYQILAAVESAAFYDGHYLAVGFGAGPCSLVWCHNLPCQALEPGKPCRHPLKARASMEAMGFDVFRMTANAGWDIYPVGRSCDRDQLPHINSIGLVLID